MPLAQSSIEAASGLEIDEIKCTKCNKAVQEESVIKIGGISQVL